MTNSERLEALADLARRHAKASSVSKKAARQVLIDEGFYTTTGALAVEYGGRKPATQVPRRKSKS